MILMRKAKDVQVGDRIFNRYAYHPAAQWERVTGIRHAHDYVAIETSTAETWKHPEEGLAVQPWEDET